jgi:hypothetical protein
MLTGPERNGIPRPRTFPKEGGQYCRANPIPHAFLPNSRGGCGARGQGRTTWSIPSSAMTDTVARPI